MILTLYMESKQFWTIIEKMFKVERLYNIGNSKKWEKTEQTVEIKNFL